MSKASPIPNLLVIRSQNIERAVTFYETLGIRFERHSHGKGPEHYAAEICGFVFEIYPQRDDASTTTNTRFGFNVDSVDRSLELLAKLDVDIESPAKDSEWGRRAVVRDLDGHTVELVTPPPKTRETKR
jgi:catechol 2,3-dioxygenase-like lactoylglutathione lyase family enzyme